MQLNPERFLRRLWSNTQKHRVQASGQQVRSPKPKPCPLGLAAHRGLSWAFSSLAGRGWSSVRSLTSFLPQERPLPLLLGEQP